jgi:hypothetical protein
MFNKIVICILNLKKNKKRSYTEKRTDKENFNGEFLLIVKRILNFHLHNFLKKSFFIENITREILKK